MCGSKGVSWSGKPSVAFLLVLTVAQQPRCKKRHFAVCRCVGPHAKCSQNSRLGGRVAFSMYFGSMWVFGFTAIAHLIIIGAIVVTVATFKVTRDMDWGYRTPSRSRAIYHNGKRIPLDPNDVGGEHE